MKFTITGTFDNPAAPQLNIDIEEAIIELKILNGNQLNFGIGAALQDLASKEIYPSEVGLDFLILATHVYAADTRISRKIHSQDNWTREIKLIVPVSDLSVWSKTSGQIIKLLNFLTGDKWVIEFIARPESHQLIINRPSDNANNFPFTKLQLFSGGLDSLIGAIDNLQDSEAPLFISHASDAATSQAQNDCYNVLQNKYADGKYDRLRAWISIPTDLINGTQLENTTRSRSFLFFALAVFAGSGIKNTLKIEAPENGFIALNVPLDMLRLGSLSTHTTHPYYIHLWNELLINLKMNCELHNPYWNKTKGEMMIECKNQALLEDLIPVSMSCASPSKGRWKGHPIMHCGYCFPCLIRRAAVKKSSIKDKTTYSIPNLKSISLNSLKPEGHQIRSCQIAINNVKRTKDYSVIIIRKSGPLPDAKVVDDLGNVYFRGLMEVGELLKGVVTEPQ